MSISSALSKRLTDRTKKVFQLASQQAQRFNHDCVGTEHILLALILEGRGVAAYILRDLNVDLSKVQREIEKGAQRRPLDTAVGGISQASSAKKVIEYAMQEAKKLNHYYIGTEHILLGLLCDRETAAAQVLTNLGLKLDDVRAEVQAVLGPSMENGRNERGLVCRWGNPSYCLRTGSPHISVGRVGRAIFGLFALLSSFTFATCATLLAIPQAVGPRRALLRALLVDSFAVASVFMLLTCITFWTRSSRFVDPILDKMFPKVYVIILAFVLGIMVLGVVCILVG
jgi:hypothetical protein